ncbi:MAG TPA: hypothetical protein VIV57_19165 [Anaeromyxobacter sp.]
MPNEKTSGRPLRAGDLVEVRGAAEILATLDAEGELDALPFMPEMIGYVGRRFPVAGRAEKVCDTVRYSGSRRLADTVLLADLRCDGAGHAGCQAECRLFWKEAWLRRVEPGAPSSPPPPGHDEAVRELAARAGAHTTRTVQAEKGSALRYRCQATELPRATVRLRTLDPRPYLRELTCGNVSLGRFLRVTARAAIEEPLARLGLVADVPVKGTSPSSPKTEQLGLGPGEWVQVRSAAEIEGTLNDKGKNRGLWFDREMLAFCGRTFRVRRRITKIVDDRTGELIEMKSDCVTLEGVVCSGDRSLARWFCPRQIYPYWREGWLRRAEAPAEAPAAESPDSGDAPPAARAAGAPGPRSG